MSDAVIQGRPFMFGKLPAHGDFVGHGLEPTQRTVWDLRCAAALDAAGTKLGRDFRIGLEAVALRGFLLAPSDDEPYWQAGCVAPSCDRAGRAFLLVLGVARTEAWDDHGHDVAVRLAPCLRRAIVGRQLADAVLAQASAALAEPKGGEGDMPVMEGWATGWIVDAATAMSDGRSG